MRIPGFLRVDKLVGWMFTPKHTLESVTQELVSGLESGDIVLDQESAPVQNSQSKGIKIVPISDNELKDLDGLLIRAAKDYFKNNLGIKEVYEHIHKGAKAVSAKVPAGNKSEEFLFALPIFVITNLSGQKELRVYRNQEDFSKEVPDNSPEILRCSYMVAIMCKGMGGDFPEGTEKDVLEHIIDFEKRNGEVPKDYNARKDFEQRVIEERLTSPTYKPNILGLLYPETYYISMNGPQWTKFEGKQGEEQFATLYFRDGERGTSGDIVTADGVSFYSAPRSEFEIARQKGDTATIFRSNYLI